MTVPLASQKLPISVICPVRNCRAALPEHAAHLRMLAPLVEEILVVDSHSTDGTAAYLREALAGTGARFLDHPPWPLSFMELWNLPSYPALPDSGNGRGSPTRPFIGAPA